MVGQKYSNRRNLNLLICIWFVTIFVKVMKIAEIRLQIDKFYSEKLI